MSHSGNGDEESGQKQNGSSSDFFRNMSRKGAGHSSRSIDESKESPDANQRGNYARASDDTTSNKSGHSGQGPYEIIEYDINEGITAHGIDVMVDLDPLRIDDDSPAAAALRANANVKVSSMGKAARAVHLQTVRKMVKRASLSSKSGVVRGKPPRLPPTIDGGIAEYQSSPLDIIDESAELAHDSNQHESTSGKEAKATITIPVMAGTAEAGKKGMVKSVVVLAVC